MLKKRVIALLVVRNGIVVQSIGFQRYLPVGSIDVAVEFLSKWGIDEIILLDISASIENRQPDYDAIGRISTQVFVPITVGGGIKTLEDIRRLLHAGADKVSINSTALQHREFISEAGKVFGVQCIVVSMDVSKKADGQYEVFTNSGKTATGWDPSEWAREVERFGAGEILVNSIDRDGMKVGYDIDLLRRVVAAVSIPVILCGGVGTAEHFRDGIDAGASAVGAGNYFHFTEHSPIVVKSYLKNCGLDIRLDTHARYQACTLEGITGRIAKRDESYLSKLRFEYQKDEVI